MFRKSIILLFLCFGLQAPAQSLISKIDKGLNDRSDVLAIYENGQLVYEEFRNGYQRQQKHKLWSVSKSLTSLLIGRAVEQKRLLLEDSICEYVSISQLASVDQCDVTVEKILFWQSGTDWSETYIGWDGGKSSVLSGLYGEGIEDFATYYFSLPYLKSVTNNWNYSTGDTNILSHILRQVYSPTEYDELPWRELFDVVGIQEATFERDQTGLYLGGAYIFLSHPSLYKVARFVLQELQTPNHLPPHWFDRVLTPQPDAHFDLKMVEDRQAPAIPAGHWWVNRPSNPLVQEVPWSHAPADTFAAFGVFGQMMIIIPSMDVVIIRLAQDLKGDFDKANLLKVVFEYLEGNS